MYPKLHKRILYSILVAFAIQMAGRTQKVVRVAHGLESVIKNRV